MVKYGKMLLCTTYILGARSMPVYSVTNGVTVLHPAQSVSCVKLEPVGALKVEMRFW